ncbi:MAG: hypothetical protein EU539_07155 [Promethearchaeota archaeon]|nr:MAG: hypothetical protein EU539_07155 [Candidatus Lokiarchaeota archaeon]
MNEINAIADQVIYRIDEELNKSNSLTEDSENYLNVLEPKQKVIDQKEFSTGVKVFGFALLSLCVFYWIYFFFIAQDLIPLTHTTYLTLILISLSCINKFESAFLNSFLAVSSMGFFLISVFLLNSIKDTYSLLGGPVLHFAMAGFQLFIVLHKRIPASKRYLLIGFIFYIIYLSNYDNYSRLIEITNMKAIYTELMTSIQIFYVFILCAIGVYFYKKKYGILLP